MGYGQPVDDIDNTCRNHQVKNVTAFFFQHNFKLCLHCVKMDTNHECDGNMQPYRVFGQIYQNGRRLLCKDPPGSCAWLACQCDVNMGKFNPNRGSFSIDQSCTRFLFGATIFFFIYAI